MTERQATDVDQREAQPFRVLFVCTGNTCRSPMAEALARRDLGERGWRHVEVRSAGVGAYGGEPASDGALRVAERHGVDLAAHRSTSLTPDLVEWADLILVMSPGHLMRVCDLGGEGRVSLLTAFAQGDDATDPPEAVPDPFGGDDLLYEETFAALDDLVRKALGRLEPILAP